MNNQDNFYRVNEPRADKIIKIIQMIEKSAAAYRVPHAAEKMKRDIVAIIANSSASQQAPSASQQAPSSRPPATPPIVREVKELKDLSTQQLVDRMIACGAELAGRRK